MIQQRRIILQKTKFSRLQSFLDQILQLSFVRYIFGKRIVVKPKPGLLLVMCGNKCLHSVRPVTGERDRVSRSKLSPINSKLAYCLLAI